VIGLSSDEFWRMTMAEFNLAAQAHEIRQRWWRHVLAWVSANIMNMWTKKTIRMARLLNEKGSPELVNAAQADAFFESENDRLRNMADRREKRLEKVAGYGS
jgi:hypothetical protein